MKSKFMKSMKLLWQVSPVEENTESVLQEKENTRQGTDTDPALAKEYVQALIEKQIPQPLLDKMADLINESIPELVRQSIDKEAEKQNIYNHLLVPFTDYIQFIYEKIQTEGLSQWKQDESRLKDQVKELNDYIRELSAKQEESQNQYLSAERQKRALGERVHELEMRIVTFEAEKEQSDMEKSALNNKLKVAAVQEKNRADELLALQEEKSHLEQRLEEIQQIGASFPEKLQEANQEVDRLRQQLDAAMAQQNEKEKAFGILQTENAELQEKCNRAASENEELHDSLTKVLHAKEDAVRQAVEREEMLKHKIDALSLEKEKFATLSVSRDSEIESVRNKITELSQELEKYKETDTALHDAVEEASRLKSSLLASEQQLQALEQDIENKAQENTNLQALIDELKDKVVHLEKEKEQVSALLQEKSEEASAQQSLSEELEVSRQNIADLKHQLLVANDMLTAVKSQRQDLFAEVEKEKTSRMELQQKLTVAENSVRQFESDQQIDRKNIRALTAEIDELKDALRKSDRNSSFLDEPEELDWLVPTRPDTPEEIARKKAEKKLQEELVEEEKKVVEKPDPSQMSLW